MFEKYDEVLDELQHVLVKHKLTTQHALVITTTLLGRTVAVSYEPEQQEHAIERVTTGVKMSIEFHIDRLKKIKQLEKEQENEG